MSDGDDFERLLRKLGEVDAPAGLESRVLRRMQERPPVRSKWWNIGRVSALTVGAVVAAIAVGVWEVRKPAGEPGLINVGKTIAPLSSPAASANPQVSSQPLSAANSTSLGTALPMRTQKINRSPDQKLLELPAEFAQEAGFPAPEAPLTEQEKLLLRLARRPNQGTIAMFDPRLREERAATEAAEFEFFNPQQPMKTEQIEETRNEATPGK